jgi:putative tryptophan/tyrosine transport system substrate-binding protein
VSEHTYDAFGTLAGSPSWCRTRPPALAAKKATTTVPIVVISGDPVAAGLVASLAKPGGNVTGIANQLIEVRAKGIQTFLEAVPGISEIGYLVRPDNPSVVQGWQ